MPELVLHTHNLAINNGDVERRMFDFREAMRRIHPDIILAQEVSSDIGLDALSDLTFELGSDYDMVYSPVYPGQEDEQGVAIISQLPILHTSVTKFGRPEKKLQIAEVQANDESVLLTNAHLKSGLHEATRIRDVLAHNRNISSLFPDMKQIMGGDFNALPLSPVMLLLKKVLGYKSEYEQVHGQEPDFTFPMFDAETLVEGHYITPNELAMLEKVAKIVHAKRSLLYGIPSDIPHYTTDYVLTKNMPPAKSATILDRVSHDRPAIADHAGITVTWPL